MGNKQLIVEEGSRLHQIHQLVNEMTDEDEVQMVFQIYSSAIRRIREKQMMHAKITCVVGCKVYWESKKRGERTFGKLTEIKRTRGVVRLENGQLWNVPLASLKRAEMLEGEEDA
jgi:hypothetical protein